MSRFLGNLGRGVAIVLMLLLGVAAHGAQTEGVDATTRKPSAIESHDAALDVYQKHYDAGDRNVLDTSGKDYKSVSQECRPTGEIDLSAGDVIVWPGPAILCGYIITVSPGTAASSIDDNATAKIPLPVSFPVNSYPGHGAVFAQSLRLKRGASATGKVVIMFKPTDPIRVTWP